jgi:hypothetical protein
MHIMLRAGVVVGLSLSLFASSAVAADGQPNWPDLGRPAAVGGGENDAALVIGIEDYQYVADIPGAVQNARDWYRYLVDGRKVPVRAVRLLRNGEADRETMLQAAKDMAAQVKPGGTFWVVFIGHGAPSQDGKEGVLIGSDAKQTAVSLFARSVRQSELQAQVGSTPAVMLFDSCFSGRAHTGAALAAGLQPLILTKAMAPATTTLLTAAQADQFAGGLPGKDRPAFSYLMLGALRGWGDANGDGQVTATEALEYATKALAVLPIGRTQTPELVGGGASRVLAARAFEREPDLDAIITGEFRPADVPAVMPEPVPVAVAPVVPPPPAPPPVAPPPVAKRAVEAPVAKPHAETPAPQRTVPQPVAEPSRASTAEQGAPESTIAPVKSSGEVGGQTKAASRPIGLMFGLRTGYAIPFGDESQNFSMAESFGGAIPIQLDVAYAIIEAVNVGVYGGYGIGSEGTGGSLAQSGFRSTLAYGVQSSAVLAHGGNNAWGGVFAGLESMSYPSRVDIQSVSVWNLTLSGWQAGVQCGYDFKLAPPLFVGPFASFAYGQYVTIKGELDGSTLSEDIVNTAAHQWLTVGLRGTYGL